jgi:hypothetical protein
MTGSDLNRSCNRREPQKTGLQRFGPVFGDFGNYVNRLRLRSKALRAKRPDLTGLSNTTPWGYGPDPHAAVSRNPGNIVDTTPLQFRNTFAPHETPSCAPLAPLSSSQPSLVPATSTTSQKRASQAGPGGPAPKRARHSDAENVGPAVSTPNTDIPITATGPFISPIGEANYQHPAFTAFTSILPKDQKNTKVASDVWFCVKGSQTKQRPEMILTNLPDEGLFLERPKDKVAYPYLACCLCT